MIAKRRNCIKKLDTLLNGADLRITQGEPYVEVRDFDFSSYYPEDEYLHKEPLPTGDNVFDIRDYGAKPGSDVSNSIAISNASAINRAIEEATKCCGTVLIDGGEYISTTVFLQSNITLFINYGSSVSANPTGLGFEKKSLIYGKRLENITITGGGRLKGAGNRFGLKPQMDYNMTEDTDVIDVIEMRRDYRAQLRFAHPSKYGGPLNLQKCTNVDVHNFAIENSAYWTFRIQECNNVTVKDFVINNNRNVANADGFDIVGGKGLSINHCFVSTADDGICMKNAIWLGCHDIMKDIEISNCTVISRTNAIKVGTETTHDIKNIHVHNCKLMMTDLYPGSVSGISLEACDGTRLKNIKIENIEMSRCTCPIFIRLGNRNRAAQVSEESANAIEFGKTVPNQNEDQSAKQRKIIMKNAFDHKSSISGIEIKDVTATGVELPIIIAGYKQGKVINRVKDVTLSDIKIEYAHKPEIVDHRLFIPEYADVYPESWRFRNLPAYTLWARHTENLSYDINTEHPQSTYKRSVVLRDCKNCINTNKSN